MFTPTAESESNDSERSGSQVCKHAVTQAVSLIYRSSFVLFDTSIFFLEFETTVIATRDYQLEMTCTIV